MTGNNRTKPGVIGLRGVVKKAVGLGGWHWLRLENGAECRLQRNALAVVARPTGLEMDSESDDDDVNGVRYGRGAAGARAGLASARTLASEHELELPSRDDGAFSGRPRRAARSAARRAAPDDERRRRRDRGARGVNEPSVRFDKLRRETLEKISAKHYNVDPSSFVEALDSNEKIAVSGATGATTTSGKRERFEGTDAAADAGGGGDAARPEKRALVENIAKRFTSETVDETKVLIAFVKMLAGGELPSPEPSRDA